MDPNKTSLYEAAQIVIIKHKRLFPAITRFRAAANYTISINRKRHGKSQKQRRQEFNYKAREDGDHASGLSKVAHERITSSPNVEDWSLVPNPVVEGWLPVLRWCIIAPLHATLFYTIPNCKTRTNLYLVTFLMSVFWIAIFSYIHYVFWMVSNPGGNSGSLDNLRHIEMPETTLDESYPKEKKLPCNMQITTLPIIRYNDCRESYTKAGQNETIISESMLCAGFSEDGSACFSDPLMVKNRKNWVIAGIVSNEKPDLL
uniref:Uncharacterized protein n=1 Tax=Tetranychus urticae TaxID=32264 RepID=T1L3E4_TETUR